MRNEQLLMTQKELQRTPWSLPLLWFTWIVLLLGFGFGCANQLSTIYEERLTFVWWTEILVFWTRLGLIFALLFRLVNSTNPWAINFGFMFTILFMLMECCTIIAKALLIPSINKSPFDVEHAGSALILGNDPLYCCLYGNKTISKCNFDGRSGICNVTTSGGAVTDEPLKTTRDDLNRTIEFDIALYLTISLCVLGAVVFILSVLAKRTLYAMRTFTDEDGNIIRKEIVELENIGGAQQRPHRRSSDVDIALHDLEDSTTHVHFQ